MISVQQIQPLTYNTVPASTVTETQQDINGNMIGSGLPASGRANKAHSDRGHSLDSQTLLVILNTVLNTQHKTPFPADKFHKEQTAVVESKICNSHVSESSKTSPIKQKKLTIERRQSFVDIDGKIERAMDSVKMELLSTVRKEVQDLKSQVVALQKHNSRLEAENRILRSAATPEILAQLKTAGDLTLQSSSIAQPASC